MADAIKEMSEGSTPATLAPEPALSSHRHLAVFMGVGLTAVLGALYGRTLAGLAWEWWDDPNYSHGFLVAPLSAFLVWRSWDRLSAAVLSAKGTWSGLVVLVAGLAVLTVGDMAAELFLVRSSLILVAAGLILFHLGPSVLRVLLFPIGFLLFMIPLPATVFYRVTFPLQGLVALSATWTLDRLGVPALLDGNIIHLSHLSLGVSEACSGIRSLTSLVALAVAWGHLSTVGARGFVLFVLSAVPITILANIGRVVSTGLIAQWVDVEYARGFFHVASGWLVFVVAFLCLLGVHGVLRLFPPAGRRDAP